MNKNTKLTITISIILLLLVIVGASYAYFTSTVAGEEAWATKDFAITGILLGTVVYAATTIPSTDISYSNQTV